MKIGKTEICKKTKEQQQMKYQKKKKKIKIKHIRRCCMGPEIKSKNFLWHIFKFYFLVEQKKKKNLVDAVDIFNKTIFLSADFWRKF